MVAALEVILFVLGEVVLLMVLSPVTDATATQLHQGSTVNRPGEKKVKIIK